MRTLNNVDSYTQTIERIGGYASAEFSLAISETEGYSWLSDYLGAHVEVVDGTLHRVWEGFVNEVEVSIGGLVVKHGPLQDIGNRVKLLYTDTNYEEEDGVMVPVAGDQTETLWAEDVVSQLRYGVFEKTLQAGWIDDTTPGPNEAIQLRDMFLHENAWPAMFSEIANLEGNTLQVAVHCLGYVEKLDYVYNNKIPNMSVVDNGDFELLGSSSLVFAGWWPYLGGGTVSVEAVHVADGYYAAKLTSGAELNTVIQRGFDVTPGATHTVRMACSGDGSHAGEVCIWDEVHDVDILARTSTGITSTEYSYWEHSFSAPEGCTTCSLKLFAPASDGASAYFDNITITYTTIGNGSFEQLGGGSGGAFEGWWEYLGGGAVSVESEHILSGLYAAKLTCGNELNTVIQRGFYTTPGVTYTVLVATSGDGTNAGDVCVWDEIHDVAILERTSTLITENDYDYYQYSFMAPDECTTCSIKLFAPPVDGSISYFDDLSITPSLSLVKMLYKKIEDILNEDRNNLFSSGNSFVEQNPLLVPAYEDQDAEALTLIKDMVNEGDVDYNKYCFMVLNDRNVIYQKCSEPYDYVIRIRNGTNRIEYPDGSLIPLTQVMPGKWVFLADVLGNAAVEKDVEHDPRLIFIESVTYTMPSEISLSGGKNNRVEARLAQFMLEGI
jgi:hypothetical protein